MKQHPDNLLNDKIVLNRESYSEKSTVYSALVDGSKKFFRAFHTQFDGLIYAYTKNDSKRFCVIYLKGNVFETYLSDFDDLSTTDIPPLG